MVDAISRCYGISGEANTPRHEAKNEVRERIDAVYLLLC